MLGLSVEDKKDNGGEKNPLKHKCDLFFSFSSLLRPRGPRAYSTLVRMRLVAYSSVFILP